LALGTFKYRMMLRGGGEFAQTVRISSYGGEGRKGVGQIVINLYSGRKSLIYSSSCSVYGICGEGLAENVKLPSYRRRESKVAQKMSLL